MRTSQKGLDLIKRFEGYRGTRYLDSVGVPTIGYGTTAADIGRVPATCTPAQAEAWLASGLARKYEPAVNALGVPLNQNQFDALVSLCYNCGPGAMQWQIGTDLRAGNYKAASADFMRYVYAGGRPLQGLINRRTAERRLFDTPWRGPTPVPPPKPLEVEQTVAVASQRDFDFELFAETKDGEILHRWQKGGRWQPWVSLGKPGK